jgi:putative inorganic carbon (HCO3(-)) transporter
MTPGKTGANGVAAGKEAWFPGLMFAGLALLTVSLTVSVAGTSISLGLCLVLAVVDRFTRPTFGWRRTPLDESLGLLVAMTFLSTVFSPDRSRSFLYFSSAWNFLIFYVYAWYVPSPERARPLVKVFCAMGAAVSLYAVFQHYTGVAFFGDPLSSTNPFASEAVRYISRGTFSHHQTFANVALMMFSLGFSLALEPAPLGRRLMTAGLAVVLGMAVVFSYTRGVWLAALAALLTIAFFKNRRALGLTAAALVLVWAVVATVPSTYSDRARSIFTFQGNIDRLVIWETSWAMLRDHPILGIGSGNFPRLQEQYLPPAPGARIGRSHAHNIYLHLAVERGVFAFVAFGWMWYVVLRIGLSSLRFLAGRSGYRLAAMRGAVGGVIGFLTDGLFQNNFGDSEVRAVLLFLLALIVILRVRQSERADAGQPGGMHAQA